MRKLTIWVPTRSDTNRPVQSQDGWVTIRVAICVALEKKKINIFVFSFFLVNYNLRPGLYSSNNYFGSRVFSNFTIVGNGNSPVQELQKSVLDRLNEIICSLDNVTCMVAYEYLDETLLATNT